MKACTKCGIRKPLGEFHRKSRAKDGRGSKCKSCRLAEEKERYQSNRQKKIAYQSEYRAKNIERVRAYDRFREKRDALKRAMQRRRRYRLNREKVLQQQKDYYPKRSREMARAAQRRHYKNHKDRYEMWRMEKKNRVPPWFGELDQLASDQACDLREMRNECTGIEWHVDHIIPLKGKKVSGLHVWNNLQVIPAVENLRKGNSYELEAA